jgi:hypothetical protein
MKGIGFITAIIVIFSYHHASAQQSGAVKLKMPHAKQNPQRIVADSSANAPTPSLHPLTHSKQSSNVPLPLDAATVPPSGAVVPGDKK